MADASSKSRRAGPAIIWAPPRQNLPPHFTGYGLTEATRAMLEGRENLPPTADSDAKENAP